MIHIRRKEVQAHREWMIRMFSLSLAVATIRALGALAGVFFDMTLEESFGASFWLPFTINLAVAEMWIRATRPKRRAPKAPELSMST